MAQKSKKKHDKKHDGKKKQKVTVIEESPLASHEEDDDLLSSLEGIAEKEEKKTKRDSGGKKKKKKDKSAKKDKDGKGRVGSAKKGESGDDDFLSDEDHLDDLGMVAAEASGATVSAATEEEEDDGLLDVDDLMPEGIKVPGTKPGPSLSAVPQMGISSFNGLADSEAAPEPLAVSPSITPREVAYSSQKKAEHASTAHIAPPTLQQQAARPTEPAEQAAQTREPAQQTAEPAGSMQQPQVAEPVLQTPQPMAPVQQVPQVAEPVPPSQPESSEGVQPQTDTGVTNAVSPVDPHVAERAAEFERLERELKEGTTPSHDLPTHDVPMSEADGKAVATAESTDPAMRPIQPLDEITAAAAMANAAAAEALGAKAAGGSEPSTSGVGKTEPVAVSDASLPVFTETPAVDAARRTVDVAEGAARRGPYEDTLSGASEAAASEAASHAPLNSSYTPVSQEPPSETDSSKAKLRTEIEPIDVPVVGDAETTSLEDVIANLSGDAVSGTVVAGEPQAVAKDARPQTARQASDAGAVGMASVPSADSALHDGAPSSASDPAPDRAADVTGAVVPGPGVQDLHDAGTTGVATAGEPKSSSPTDAQGVPEAVTTQTDAISAGTEAKPKESKGKLILLIVLLIILAAVIGVFYGLRPF